MSSARGHHHGFLVIDKPAGISSHDVVARVRRLAGQRQVGHAGTLDPAATGVLIVALGGATRLIEYVQDETRKRYLATVELGVTTDSDDAEGQVTGRAPLPALDAAAIERVLAPLRGEITQVPPMYSALHHQGRRLYELARAGEQVERAARPVRIDRLDLLSFDPPLLTLDVLCSKGTYIRAIARDIGQALGCGGHLRSLRRTAVGAFSIERAIALDELAAIDAALLPPETAVASWPAIELSAEQQARVRNGLPIDAPHIAGDRARCHGPDGRLLAILVYRDGHWRPHKVFHWQAVDQL
jgi:tRNA pseudouridine55 synthase